MDILIVDNSKLIIKRLEELLSELAGIKSLHLASGYIEASELLEAVEPHVVLLDIMLPLNKSVDLLKEIRKTKRKTVVIVLSNYADPLTRKKYNVIGADYFFDKFNDMEKIAGTIKTIAANKK